MKIEDGSHSPCTDREPAHRKMLWGADLCNMPAPPDRACRWNDLEASWSFHFRDQKSGISNQR
jgi:hypothetical protein